MRLEIGPIIVCLVLVYLFVCLFVCLVCSLVGFVFHLAHSMFFLRTASLSFCCFCFLCSLLFYYL